MKRFFSLIIFLISIMLLSGCATNPQPSGYSKFYSDRSGAEFLDPQEVEVLEQGAEPLLISGSDIDSDTKKMLSDGFMVIGFSSFNGNLESIDNAKTQAQKVGATHVLLYSQLTQTSDITVPIKSLTPGQQINTTYSRHSTANAYGTYGSVNASGNYTGTSSTYVPGKTTTNYMPLRIERYDQVAAFYVKKKRKPSLGLYYLDVPEERRREIGTNQGVIVQVVIKGTPAYKADLFEDDIIISFNNEPIYSMSELNEKINHNKGKEVILSIIRGDKTFDKALTLGP